MYNYKGNFVIKEGSCFETITVFKNFIKIHKWPCLTRHRASSTLDIIGLTRNLSGSRNTIIRPASNLGPSRVQYHQAAICASTWPDSWYRICGVFEVLRSRNSSTADRYRTLSARVRCVVILERASGYRIEKSYRVNRSVM